MSTSCAASPSTRAFRKCLARFATGITVVTTRAAGGWPVGVTVNSVCSVSLSPPLVLFALDRRALSLAAFQTTPAFAINVLGEEQEEISRRFAKGRADKWTGTKHVIGRLECPLLDGAIASLECARHAQYDGGDHVLFVGRVIHAAWEDDARPLLFFRSRYHRLADGPSWRDVEVP